MVNTELDRRRKTKDKAKTSYGKEEDDSLRRYPYVEEIEYMHWHFGLYMACWGDCMKADCINTCVYGEGWTWDA